MPPHPGNCHHSFPAPVVSESARPLTAESRRGNRPSQSPLWWLKSADLQEELLVKGKRSEVKIRRVTF